MLDRLAWDSRVPAPFESALSVFSKVLSINYMSMPELEKLIALEPADGSSAIRQNYLSSNWINFERYASLLGVTAERLQEGFLDQLGIERTTPLRHGMRHCPQCEVLGYHCVLFELDLIDECPWHRCKLVKSWMPGSSLRSINRAKSFCVRGAETSGLISMQYFQVLEETLRYTIIGYCKEFLDWCKEVNLNTAHCPWVMDALINFRLESLSETQLVQWQLGFAKSMVKTKLCWKFSVQDKPACLISRDCLLIKGDEIQKNYYMSDDVGHCYRSIRRHIYKRYLSAHHACIKYLINLSRDEVLFLHSQRACLPAVAFPVWRMSVEGICNIETLRSRRKKKIPLRLMQPNMHLSSLAIDDQIRWTYDVFFGLLAALEDLHSHYWRVTVSISESRACDDFLQLEFNTYGASPSDSEGSLVRGIIQVLRPEIPCLKERTCQKWRDLSQSSDRDMCDAYAFNSAMSWYWSCDRSSMRTSLFKFTQSERYGQPIFQHFNV